MVFTPHRGICWRWFQLQYGVGNRDPGKSAVYICTSALGRSDDAVFGLDLRFLNAG